ncbi:hypothetical protein V5O48_001056 [Marasmius crinis-equi]|uniref:Uncharacterized protein n=1 Tax=Marasmius crinis-equi TaxID=585013 RepID=A0ABR3FZL6_9AGAR
MAGRRVSTLPSMEASQQAHIDDLVQRNRTLDHTIKKLKEQVESEKSRATTTITNIQSKWRTEKDQWREACDTLQACHRIAYLRLQGELQTERMNVLFEQEANMKEKVAKAQRDTMITKFQIRESELERTIQTLEEKAEESRLGYEQESRAMKGKVAELVARLQGKDEIIEAGEAVQEDFQNQIAELQKSRAEGELSTESLSSQVERVNLQLDGERKKNADLERANDEFRRTNEDLKRQIDKWKSLENKGGAETDSLRKKRVELEVQVQSLETKLAKREEDLEKNKQRLKSMRQNIQEWEDSAKDLQSQVEALEVDLDVAKKENVKLRSELKAHRTASKTPPVAAPSRRKPKVPEPEFSQDDVQEVEELEEVEEAISQPGPSSPPESTNTQRRAPASSRRQEGRKRQQGNDEDEIQEVSPPAKGKGKAREISADEGHDEPGTQRTRTKSKPASQPRSKPGSKAKPADAETDSEVQEIPSPPKGKGKGKERENSVQPTATKNGRKRRATTDDEDEEEVVPQKNKRRKQNGEGVVAGGTRPKPKPKSKAAPPSRAASDETGPAAVVDDSASNLAGNKPKKRKINLFSGNNAVPSFDFSNNGLGGLNIPTTLSPVREEQVPVSTASRALSMLKYSFSGKR